MCRTGTRGEQMGCAVSILNTFALDVKSAGMPVFVVLRLSWSLLLTQHGECR